LLDALAVASDEDFVLAGLVFLADARNVAFVLARMSTRLLLAAVLLAALPGVFAFARFVACLAAVMVPALKSATADPTTAYILQPAGLILQLVFST
jgi:hypothetical protein